MESATTASDAGRASRWAALGRVVRSRVLRWTAGALFAVLLATALGIYLFLRSSLPQLTGELAAPGIAAPVQITRDAAGVPTLTAQSRTDLAFATGLVHAQDRFFQMDLQRRASAGELAELLGPAVLQVDRSSRLHDFRRLARQILQQAGDTQRQIIDAYTAGVNFRLNSQRASWEYSLLGSTPARWLPEDVVLTAFALYLDLNDSTGKAEHARELLRSTLPAPVFAFLTPLGTEWDAPLSGGVWRAPPTPGRDVLDLRPQSVTPQATGRCLGCETHDAAADAAFEPNFVGSNAWAVAGTHTDTGHALLANDMHLSLRLPHIWYRAHLKVTGDPARDLLGVTLPGLPSLIAGSNGSVAWGFTNSYGDWTDLVVVETDAAQPERYRVGEQTEAFTTRREIIKVRGAAPETLEVRGTRWGPIVATDPQGRPLALAWTAHEPRATNLGLFELERAQTLEQLLDTANRVGAPVQNFVAAQSDGRIGWTLMGQVPVRANYDSTIPTSWRSPDTGWVGWRQPEEYPRIIEPAAGRIWSANARGLDSQTWLAFMGEANYDHGARAGQIRDGLFARERASAQDMVAIQLDDRALFLTRWRDLLLELLNDKARGASKQRELVHRLVTQWSGRAAVDDVGYRIVRAFRMQVLRDVFDDFTTAARKTYPDVAFAPSNQFEGPLWQLVTQRPPHLLDPQFETWENALLASLDTVAADMAKECGQIERCSWGQRNTLQMQHPLAGVLPLVGRWLNMPDLELPGDSWMPRVQGPRFGASERLVVSPGRESEGYFQMPGGPVDHPLSPFYGKGHREWARGEPLPLLPGPAEFTLMLRPAAAAQGVP